MTKRTWTLLALAIALVVPLTAQKREAKPQKIDFKTRITRGQKAYDESKFGTCVSELREALLLATAKWREALRAALPAAPQGWKLEPAPEQNEEENPYAAAVIASTGGLLSADYRNEDGSGHIDVQIMADSPAVRMMQGMFAMAGMRKDVETVDYEGGDKALLEKVGDEGYKLTILVAQKHLITVETSSLTDEQVFRFMDQAALTKIKAQL